MLHNQLMTHWSTGGCCQGKELPGCIGRTSTCSLSFLLGDYGVREMIGFSAGGVLRCQLFDPCFGCSGTNGCRAGLVDRSLLLRE
jgi:hypothetical protein